MCFSQLALFALILAHHNPTMYSLPTTTILLDQNTARTPPEPITTSAQHVRSPYINTYESLRPHPYVHILTSASLRPRPYVHVLAKRTIVHLRCYIAATLHNRVPAANMSPDQPL
jgi:hypothetical protein